MDDEKELTHYQIVIYRHDLWLTQEIWEYESFRIWKPSMLMRLWYRVITP